MITVVYNDISFKISGQKLLEVFQYESGNTFIKEQGKVFTTVYMPIMDEAHHIVDYVNNELEKLCNCIICLSYGIKIEVPLYRIDNKKDNDKKAIARAELKKLFTDKFSLELLREEERKRENDLNDKKDEKPKSVLYMSFEQILPFYRDGKAIAFDTGKIHQKYAIDDNPIDNINLHFNCILLKKWYVVE